MSDALTAATAAFLYGDEAAGMLGRDINGPVGTRALRDEERAVQLYVARTGRSWVPSPKLLIARLDGIIVDVTGEVGALVEIKCRRDAVASAAAFRDKWRTLLISADKIDVGMAAVPAFAAPLHVFAYVVQADELIDIKVTDMAGNWAIPKPRRVWGETQQGITNPDIPKEEWLYYLDMAAARILRRPR